MKDGQGVEGSRNEAFLLHKHSGPNTPDVEKIVILDIVIGGNSNLHIEETNEQSKIKKSYLQGNH